MIGAHMKGRGLVISIFVSWLSTVVWAQSVPPAPPTPTGFWADALDPAGKVARRIAGIVPSFRNFRGEKKLATWQVDETSVWKIPPQEYCVTRLEKGVPFTRNAQSKSAKLLNRQLVATPILLGKRFELDGVVYRSYRRNDWRKTREDIVLACAMIERLRELSAIFSKYGILEVGVMSHIRVKPRTSFHTMGLAIDLAFFVLKNGERLTVEKDFLMDKNAPTCEGALPPDQKQRLMQELACEIYETGKFQTVITPNYNWGHRDHFHIDIRPDDPRLFLK